MKMDMSNQDNLKEEILNDTTPVGNAPEIDEKPPVEVPQRALDDARRIKVLSPTRLVVKRFFRNKLAIVGLAILIFMFGFCFLGGWIIPYDQKDVFYKNDIILFDYGTATQRTTYENYYLIDKDEIHYSIRNMINSHITSMEADEETTRVVYDNYDNPYTLTKIQDDIYSLSFGITVQVASYSTRAFWGTYDSAVSAFNTTETISNLSMFISRLEDSIENETLTFNYDGDDYILIKVSKYNYSTYKVLSDGIFTYSEENLGIDFENAVKANLTGENFSLGESEYLIVSEGSGNYTISEDFGFTEALYASTYVFDRYNISDTLDTDFKLAFYQAMADDEETFDFDLKTYSIDLSEEILVISEVSGEDLVPFANVGSFVVRRYNGEDTLSIEFKEQIEAKIIEMLGNGETETTFTYYMTLLDEEGNPQLDELGNPIYGEQEFQLERKLDNFVLRNFQEKYLIDIYGAPSPSHWLGTDANGMDVLTRIMYGGRISLMVGFIVIFISLFIGVILGGIAGYFGKWVDQIIMRLVDIFNCIPTLPILIIMGALFDSLRLDPYVRIMYLMVMLGVLGWSGIARLVRGQILSLREQEFMIAAEATGLKPSRRIFRHLVPNVMPQLIVSATMGLGSIIITESTLSFLGLGAKYPLATWGAMINAVSTAAAMVTYTYIWIPVGVLICLTVIAFNFVGDGLRDAFDPKMKR
jgi:peptide/nickel transport system permease protein